jgi:hypothetical protein
MEDAGVLFVQDQQAGKLFAMTAETAVFRAFPD